MIADILAEIFDNKKIAVIKLLIQNPDKKFYLQEISQQSTVPVATTLRILQKLCNCSVVDEVRISRLKLYQIAQNENTTSLEKLFAQDKQALEDFSEQISKLKNVEQVIVHGKKSASKANVLIIGNEVNADMVERLIKEIMQKHKFTISYLTVSPVQYEQMSKMGLYSGEKKVLFEA